MKHTIFCSGCGKPIDFRYNYASRRTCSNKCKMRVSRVRAWLKERKLAREPIGYAEGVTPTYS